LPRIRVASPSKIRLRPNWEVLLKIGLRIGWRRLKDLGILNRFVAVAVFLVLQPQQNTTFAGNETWFIQVTAGITGWLSWTVALLLAEWWLERRPYPADRDTPGLVGVAAGYHQ
jgi:hypothetical protein